MIGDDELEAATLGPELAGTRLRFDRVGPRR
jgi:hypothetical protein